MQLFLDIDGVLLNFERAFVAWLNTDQGLRLPENYEAEHWDFLEVLEKKTLDESWLRFLESEEVAHMPPLVDPAGFNALAGRHEVHLLTNFPAPHMHKRLRNLERHGFRYDSLNYCGLHSYKEHRPRSKATVIAELHHRGNPALFVDDHPDNCLDVHHNCPEVEVWVMSRRFNRDFSHPAIPRAQGWGCLFARLDSAGRFPTLPGASAP